MGLVIGLPKVPLSISQVWFPLCFKVLIPSDCLCMFDSSLLHLHSKVLIPSGGLSILKVGSQKWQWHFRGLVHHRGGSIPSLIPSCGVGILRFN